MNKIEKQFWDKGLVQPSGLWAIFPKSVALEFVKECKNESIKILGIDGFFLYDDGAIQPSQEHSIDFTREPYSTLNDFNVWEATLNFLNMQSDELFFEIVCEE